MKRWNEGDGWGFHVEETLQLSNRRSVDLFDMECLKIDTAIKALWILYRRGRWELLASVGLSRTRYEALFYRFDIEHISSDHGLIRRVEQVDRLVDYVPGIVMAAMLLVAHYRALYSERILSNETVS